MKPLWKWPEFLAHLQTLTQKFGLEIIISRNNNSIGRIIVVPEIIMSRNNNSISHRIDGLENIIRRNNNIIGRIIVVLEMNPLTCLFERLDMRIIISGCLFLENIEQHIFLENDPNKLYVEILGLRPERCPSGAGALPHAAIFWKHSIR